MSNPFAMSYNAEVINFIGLVKETEEAMDRFAAGLGIGAIIMFIAIIIVLLGGG